MERLQTFALLVYASYLCLVHCQLVVNVKNKGGDVIVESVQANTSLDTVQLEFTNTDGTLITQLIDFKSEVQILRVYILGEEEKGQGLYQVMCFVTRFSKNEFISSDAMSKLRQKNPTALRVPEEDKGQEFHELDLLVNVELERSHVISPLIFNICGDAKLTTYSTEADLRLISKSLGKDFDTMMSAAKRTPTIKNNRCAETADLGKPCQCRYELCIGWYPCGLKYCRGKDSSGRLVSYRCGIKTCRKCCVFDYYVPQKLTCLWDDVP